MSDFLPQLIQETIYPNGERARAVLISSDEVVLERSYLCDAMGERVWIGDYSRDPSQFERDAKQIIIGLFNELEKP